MSVHFAFLLINEKATLTTDNDRFLCTDLVKIILVMGKLEILQLIHFGLSETQVGICDGRILEFFSLIPFVMGFLGID